VTGVYVMTSPRPGEDRWLYFRPLVAAIAREEWSGPLYVLVDGSEEDAAELAELAPGWMVHRHERRPGTWLGGNKWPYWRLLELARETTAALGDAVLLEDDLELCRNAIGRMALFPIPSDVDAVHFYNGFYFSGPRAHPGLWRTPAAAMGCQAIKYPRRTLERLVDWKTKEEWQKHNESDVALGLAQARLGLRFACHMPDIVQHVGAVSLVSHGMFSEAGVPLEGAGADARRDADRTLGGRVSVNYPGKRFDAMSLFSAHDLFK